VPGSYDANKFKDSIKGGEFRDKLDELQILKKDCDPWSQLLSFIYNLHTQNLVNNTASHYTNILLTRYKVVCTTYPAEQTLYARKRVLQF
jgi:hypothetical protein